MNAQNNNEKKTQTTSGCSNSENTRSKPENRKTDKQAKNCK